MNDQIDSNLEEDIMLSFPPVRKHIVDLTITKIVKPKLNLIIGEESRNVT